MKKAALSAGSINLSVGLITVAAPGEWHAI